MNIGQFLKEKRKNIKLSLRESAKRSGVSHPYLSQIETGRNKNPGINIIKKLSLVYGFSLDELKQSPLDELKQSEKSIVNLTSIVLEKVEKERIRQNKKWGVQRHPHGTWLAILGEEFGEVCEAMQKGMVSEKPTDSDNLYEELIQVAAVAVAIAEQVLEQNK